MFAKKSALEKLPELPDVIVTDEAFLRERSVDTDLNHLKKINFVERCKKALPTAWTGGFGLAAIQLGIPIRAAWYALKRDNITHERLMWNPKIITLKWPYVVKEGCLSIPDQYYQVETFQYVKYMNGDGEVYEVSGTEAQIVIHEYRHFEGKLCSDFIAKAKPVVGRNDPCPCQSGRKFKKCCFEKGAL